MMTRKKTLSFLLVLAMMIGLLPPIGSLASESNGTRAWEPFFTTQPQNTSISPTDLSYHVTWSTNFIPTTVGILRESELFPGTYEEVTSFPGSAGSHYTFPAAALTDRNYKVAAYYTLESDPTVERCLESNLFRLSADNLVFSLQPQNTVLNGTALTWTVNWTTNFVPTKIEIVKNIFSSHDYPNPVQLTLEDNLDTSGSAVLDYNTPRDDPFYVRAYFSDTFYVDSADFRLLLPEGSFLTQPRDPGYDLPNNCYTVTWTTNFIPFSAQLFRVGNENPCEGYTVSDLSNSMTMQIPGSFSDGDYQIRLLTRDLDVVWSDPFKLDKSGLGFVVQPGPTVQIRPSDLQYVITWQTNFVPRQIKLYRADGTGWSNPDTLIATVTSNLRMEMAHVLFNDAETAYAYYIVAYYTTEGSVTSNYFRLKYDALEFSTQPYDVSFDPDVLCATTSWATNFSPTKVEVVRDQHGSDWQNTVFTVLEDPGSSNFHTFFANSSSVSSYYLRAYINDRNYILSSAFTLSDENLKFTEQPSFTFDPADGSYTVNWKTSFIPVKVCVRCRDNEFSYLGRNSITAELTENLSKDGSYTFETAPDTEHDYYLDVYYGVSDIISEDFGRSRFTTPPINGYAVAGSALTSPYRATWETNNPTTLVEVWTYDKTGAPVKFSELPANTTDYYINYRQAADSPLMRWFFRAYFVGGETCDSPDVTVLPMLTLGENSGYNMKTYPGSHAFTLSDEDQWGGMIVNNNFTDDADFHYDFIIPADRWLSISLTVTNDFTNEDNTRLRLEYNLYPGSGEPAEISVAGLNASILSVIPTTVSNSYAFELNTTIPALRRAFGLTDNPCGDVFDITLSLGSDEGYYTFTLLDAHKPVLESWWDVDPEETDVYENLTLERKAFAPSLTFDPSVSVASVKADWYAVIGTECYGDGYEHEESYTLPYRDPFLPLPLNPIEGDGSDWWQYGWENWEMQSAGIRDEIGGRFSRYFGDGYNSFVTGMPNTAPRGPENYIFGIAANKLTREGSSFDLVKVALSDFIKSSNLAYFNSLPGLSGDGWLGYYIEGESVPDAMPSYSLGAHINCVLTITFTDGAVYMIENAYLNGIEDSRFHVVGSPLEPEMRTVTLSAGYEGGDSEPITVVLGEVYTLPACGFDAPEGMMFAAWQVSVGDADPVLMQPGEQIVAAENTSVTAVWTKAKPRFKSEQLVLSGQIGMFFYMTIPDEYVEGSAMEFDVGGEKITVETAPELKQSDGSYRFLCSVNALQMADTLTATFRYTDDGTDKTAVHASTVEEYLNILIRNTANLEEYDKAKEVAKALNDYGYYSQLALDPDAEHERMGRVYQDVTELIDSLDGYAVAAVFGTGVTSASYSLSLTSETQINLYFVTDGLVLTKDNTSVGAADQTRFDWTVEKVGSPYRVQITGINAAELGSEFTVTVEGGTVLRASALSYVQQALSSGSSALTDEVKHAAAALYSFYNATYRYVHPQEGE